MLFKPSSIFEVPSIPALPRGYKCTTYGEDGNSQSPSNGDLLEERGEVSHSTEEWGKIIQYHTNKQKHDDSRLKV